jgi:hypothetical protein
VYACYSLSYGWLHLHDLDTDFDCGFFSVYLTRHTDFDCGLFRSPNLDTLILTNDFCVWNGLTAGTTGQQGMLTPPWHLIPPLIYSEVRVRPFSDWYFLLDLRDLLLIVIFVILLWFPTTLLSLYNFSIYVPFEEGRAYCFAAVCLLVSRFVGPSSFRSFSLHWLHILKWNLVYRFIIRISRARSVLGTSEPFLTELWPLDLEKFW